MKEIYGPWFNAVKCINCNQWLTSNEEIYSRGRCPKCGYKDPHAATIVKTIDVAVRNVYKPGPWYWPFKQFVRQEIRED